MADLGEFSRFSRTEEIIVDGNETFGTWAKPSWVKTKPPDRQIGVFRVTNAFEGRPDIISNQLYGTPLLEWALIAFNARYFNADARRVLNWPKAGETIYYPLENIVFPEVS